MLKERTSSNIATNSYNRKVCNLPQWQKSEETTKRLLGSARYLLKSFPNSCSFDSLSAPTNTGTMVNSSLWLISKRKKCNLKIISNKVIICNTTAEIIQPKHLKRCFQFEIQVIWRDLSSSSTKPSPHSLDNFLWFYNL